MDGEGSPRHLPRAIVSHNLHLGGRKKNSKVHERDQDWGSTGNKALLESLHSGQPVRVCRGSLTRYGPEEGYRYDGEWTVIDVRNSFIYLISLLRILTGMAS